MFDIKEELKKLPDCPGVYIHKDSSGQIIYVGKAISLRKRVRQYFQSTKDQAPKVQKMVTHIASFEYITVNSEVDALILECNLIKKYQPKYNILLRDDKSYPYIKVSVQDDFPRITKTRRLLKDGARYFGPYPFVSELDAVVELLNSLYKLKRCSKTDFPESWRPCLNYHIGRCEGACMGYVDKNDYRSRINKAVAFLDGDKDELLAFLENSMMKASEEMNYEAAAAYRDYIAAVKAMASGLRDPDNVKIWEDRKRRRFEHYQTARDELSDIIGTEVRRIESYDISNIQGEDNVGGMVVFLDGHPLKTAYRKFKIKTVEGANDFASMEEVLTRRLTDSKAGEEMPDLILMDGGAPQVKAAKDVTEGLGLPIPIAGMVKDDKHRTNSLLFEGTEYPLKDKHELYAYLGTIQEEVHRFAIAYHHQLRVKQLSKSALDEIPGIGEKRKLALLNHFKSIDAISSASIDDLLKVPEMNAKSAQSVLHYFQHK